MARHILFEGLDGAGKDTQIELIKNWLEGSERTVWTTRTPSYHPVGNLLKGYFETAKALFPGEVDRSNFMGALFAADMLEHDVEVRHQMVAGRSNDGFFTLQSRAWMSTWCYQRASPAVQEFLLRVVAPRVREPDLVLYFHADVDVCMMRIRKRDAAPVDLYETRANLYGVNEAMMDLIARMQAKTLPWKAPVVTVDTTSDNEQETLLNLQRIFSEQGLVYGN